jgi:HK97 family phage major capsid protein/HK97 family phage prohead protease
MPIPKPGDGESQDDFIGRCMGALADEFPDEAQRAAVCHSSWEDSKAIRRAYSTFHVKQVAEDSRTIDGIATTPTPDRVGDIVEPGGAQFKLPIPLLWQHDGSQPIGHVTGAKVTKDGIAIRAQLVKIPDAGRLKDRLDEAWQSIKHGLVRGLSIGFRSREHSYIQDSGGIHFTKWDWLELSAVTIPANVEASIATIKAADRKEAFLPLVKAPGVSGSTSRKVAMKTFKEQIAGYEATRAAKAAEAAEIMKGAGAEGETLAADKQEAFDTLEREIDAIDGHLKRLRVAEKLNAENAAAVDQSAALGQARPTVLASVKMKSNLEPGIRFARMAMAIARAKAGSSQGGGTAEDHYRRDRAWMDSAPEVALALKAAVNAGDTTTATWASELAYAQNIASEFIEYLRPRTIIGRVSGWRNVPFNVRVASQTSGSTGYWVGQGKPIPMSQLATSSVSLGIAKVAGMVSIDKELARLSTPSAELMVRNDLAAEVQETLDLSLIDPNQGGQTNIQPASLLYGVTPVTPSGTNYAAFVTDVKSLFSTAIAANLDISQAVWVLSPTTALALSLMVTSLGNPQFPGLTINGGTLMGLPAITTTQATIAGSPQYVNIMALIFPGEVFLADDGTAMVEASDQVAIQMDNAPTNQSTATATATTMVSMFQTESIAIKAVRYINWTKARSQAAAFIQAAAYA